MAQVFFVVRCDLKGVGAGRARIDGGWGLDGEGHGMGLLPADEVDGFFVWRRHCGTPLPPNTRNASSGLSQTVPRR